MSSCLGYNHLAIILFWVMLSTDPYEWLEKSLETIHRANWYRQVRRGLTNLYIV
ncbi:MAG: hypothetical protein EBE86_018165 [Hormoscilla sp. GUM202]|nr:hypothetical protein [Hormoscilla sp. GUM202]